ncbi:hypothetical protein FKW77_006684 [Venturia effusa]|uniref:PLL-like beta propeller domain-containing protein n=1 Tax=Venturia effusa TaxID=50376 RepID=A0A517LB09_9PEZI|nr:hypothetical protein FKW77_006684 [Venturia effusa]
MAPLVGQILHAALSAVAWTKGRLDVFSIGDDHGMYHRAYDNGWQPPKGSWENLGKPATGFASAPVAISHTVGTLDIFGVASDGQAYHKWFAAGKYGPSPIAWEAQGGKFTGSLAATSRAPGLIDIVGLGQDKIMYHKAWTGKGYVPGLTTWLNIGGDFKTEPTVASRGKDYLDIFTVGEDGKAYYKSQEKGAWQPSQKTWTSMGGVFVSKLSVVSALPGNLEVFGVGTDGGAYHKWWNGQTWSPSVDRTDWAPLGGNFSSDLVAVSKGPGKIDVFGLGPDKHAYVKSFNGSAWDADWYGLGGSFASALEVVSWADNRVDIFGIGDTKQMAHRFSIEAGKYLPTAGEWESIGGSHIYP